MPGLIRYTWPRCCSTRMKRARRAHSVTPVGRSSLTSVGNLFGVIICSHYDKRYKSWGIPTNSFRRRNLHNVQIWPAFNLKLKTKIEEHHWEQGIHGCGERGDQMVRTRSPDTRNTCSPTSIGRAAKSVLHSHHNKTSRCVKRPIDRGIWPCTLMRAGITTL